MAKRLTIGERVRAARLDAGIISVPQLAQRILQLYGKTIGESTIRDIENDKSHNPGIKTVEYIAKGIGLDPLEVINLGLDDPPETDREYTATQFAHLARIYKKVNKANKPVANQLVKMLIEQMERWR